MKKFDVKRLDWDSDFFGFEIGEITNEIDISDYLNYHLLILKQSEDKDILIDKFKKKFQETKLIFNKVLSPDNLNVDINSIVDNDIIHLQNIALYSLAFESGKYSRFKLDNNFCQNKFELLYSKWVDNSINKQFADKLFYTKELNDVIGFVTVKLNNKFATIGLIAVAENFQGRGIGKKLLSKVETYCVSNNVFELQIPTQKENRQACAFYTSLGFNIIEEKIIKHYWKISE